MARVLAIRLRCDSSTSRGALVDPDVYWITAREAGSHGGAAAPSAGGRVSVASQPRSCRPDSFWEKKAPLAALAAVVRARAGPASCTRRAKRAAARLRRLNGGV